MKLDRQRLPQTPEPDHYFMGCAHNKLAADCWGDPNNQTVILMHGGGQTRHAWKGTGQALAACGYYSITLDARGHGDSDWIENGGYHQQEMIEDVISVAAQTGGNPVLVGASMGGMVSLSAIGSGRLEAAALVLVDIAPNMEKQGTKRVLDFMQQKPEGFDNLEDVAAAIANYQPQRKVPRNLDGLTKNVRLGADGKYYWHWDPNFFQASSLEGMTSYQETLEECARQLKLPTLLVRGGMSDVLSEQGAQEFLALCPQAEYCNVMGAAHMVAGDRNDVFTSAVEEFLNRALSR